MKDTKSKLLKDSIISERTGGNYGIHKTSK